MFGEVPMKKRFLSVLLLAAMLLSLAACGGNNDNDHSNDSSTSTGDTEKLPAGIEKKNYDEEFTILYPEWGMFRDYYFVEENTGESMDVALFNRELKVEEHLGLDIEFQKADNNGDNGIKAIYPNVQQMAMTGDNLYQIVLTHCISNTAVMITDGLLLDLNTVNTINFDNDWWNHVSNENLEVAGKQFFAISDFIIPDPCAILFNKDMISTLGLENPYDLVREGKWNIDKMMEMMAVATLDDGDGDWDVDDTYGLGTPDDWFLTGLTYSLGEQLVRKDEEGMMTFALNTQRTYSVVDKIQALLESPDTYIFDYTNVTPATYNPAEALDIASGRCLFNITSLTILNLYRNTEVDFGILPYPKFDENQEDYISLDWTGLMCAPLVAEDHDMIGEVMELFAYYSSEEVLPTYYDVVLGEKLSRDDESREMLDIIFGGIVFDAGMNYFGFSTNVRKFWSMPTMISKGQFYGFSTHLASYEEGAIAEIEAFNEAVLNLE